MKLDNLMFKKAARILGVAFLTGSILASITSAVADDNNGSAKRSGSTAATSGSIWKFTGVVAGLTGSSFNVNGQAINAANARVEHGSAVNLQNGVLVEAKGVLTNGVLNAVEIDIKSGFTTESRAVGTRFEVKGVITNFVSIREFYINGQRVDASTAWFEFGNATMLANGVFVDVKGASQQAILVASTIEIGSVPGGVYVGDANQVKTEGLVSSFVSLANFTVNGQSVDASSALFEYGNAAALAAGMFVEVKGNFQSGRLIATKVDIKSTTWNNTVSSNDDGNKSQTAEAKVKGLVSNYQSISNFLVNGQQVNAAGAWFEQGNASMLGAGAYVEAKGSLQSGVLIVSKIEFK